MIEKTNVRGVLCILWLKFEATGVEHVKATESHSMPSFSMYFRPLTLLVSTTLFMKWDPGGTSLDVQVLGHYIIST